MADDTAQQDATTTEPTQTPDEPAKDSLGDAGKKALEAERRNARQAAKERDALAAELQEFRDRDKSEAEKVAGRAQEAEARATQADRSIQRFDHERTSSQSGLPANGS